MVHAQGQYDRPPEGMQRGLYPAPQWAILALGAAVVLGAVIYLGLRARRALNATTRGDYGASRQP